MPVDKKVWKQFQDNFNRRPASVEEETDEEKLRKELERKMKEEALRKLAGGFNKE